MPKCSDCGVQYGLTIDGPENPPYGRVECIHFLKLQNDVFLTALENIRDCINFSLLEQFGGETFTADERAKALNLVLQYAQDAIRQASADHDAKKRRQGS